MSVNKYLPHVVILPEDDANRALAVGFEKELSTNMRQIQTLPSAGGWMEVRDKFLSQHARRVEDNPLRHMVLLVDGDGDANHISDVRESIRKSCPDRVFVLGVSSNPEKLKQRHGSLELIGSRLAEECRLSVQELWQDELLRHNLDELNRLTPILRPILFHS